MDASIRDPPHTGTRTLSPGSPWTVPVLPVPQPQPHPSPPHTHTLTRLPMDIAEALSCSGPALAELAALTSRRRVAPAVTCSTRGAWWGPGHGGACMGGCCGGLGGTAPANSAWAPLPASSSERATHGHRCPQARQREQRMGTAAQRARQREQRTGKTHEKKVLGSHRQLKGS
jgi:hypothetical protein